MKKSSAPINLVLLTSLLLVAILVFANYKNSRNPASQKDVSSLKIPVYEFDSTKINDAKDAFKFYRAFVDFYYLTLSHNFDYLTEIAKMKNSLAWCAGDAHAENFGFLIKANKDSIFTLNDWDDSITCPAFFDITRLLVGNQLFDHNISSSDLLDQYLTGLELKDNPFPEVLLKELAKSKEKSTGISPKKLESPNRLLRSKDTEELNANEKREITNLLTSKINSNLSLIDSFKFKKVGGGSGGMQRYNVLVKISGQNYLLELKQIKDSSAAIFSPRPYAPLERLQISFDNFLMSSIHPFYTYGTIQGAPYLVRPLFDGNNGISLSKYKNKEITEVLKYEAYLLGYLHSHTLTNKEEYLNSLRDLNRQLYLNEIKEIRVLYQYLYKELK